jgi:hypothetical protein
LGNLFDDQSRLIIDGPTSALKYLELTQDADADQAVAFIGSLRGSGDMCDFGSVKNGGMIGGGKAELNFDLLPYIEVPQNGGIFGYQKAGPVLGYIFQFELLDGNAANPHHRMAFRL